MLGACGGATTNPTEDVSVGNIPNTPNMPMIAVDPDTFRTVPLDRQVGVLTAASALPTSGDVHYLGEVEFTFESLGSDDEVTTERAFGTLNLRIRHGDGVISGLVTNVRDEDGTRREGVLRVSSFRGQIDPESTEVDAPLFPDDPLPTAVTFEAKLEGLLGDKTNREVFVNASIAGNFHGQTGDALFGTVTSGQILPVEVHNLITTDFIFVANQTSAPNPVPFDPTRVPGIFDAKNEDLLALQTNSDALSFSEITPISGSAVYTGAISFPVHNGSNLAGDLRLNVTFDRNSEFAGWMSGGVNNLVRDDDLVLNGSLDILETEIWTDPNLLGDVGSGGTPTRFGVPLTGGLTGAEAQYYVDAVLFGDFKGSQVETVTGDVEAIVVFDGERIVSQGGTFSAAQ